MILTMSNDFKTLMNPVMVRKKVVGETKGKEILQNVCIGLAPSTSAASKISTGMFFKAAKKSTISYPMPLHTNTMMTAGSECEVL